MPTKEIKELRQAGKLEEALQMATVELQAAPDSIWAKRNISWVYAAYLKQNAKAEHFEEFLHWLEELENLQLPEEETMLFENLCWQVGMMVFALHKAYPDDCQKALQLFRIIEPYRFPKPSGGYSYLYKAFHKILKETNQYVHFADWWGLQNFRPEDFEKEKLQDGVEVMAFAEQAYIAYAKHLLPQKSFRGEIVFDKEKALAFLPILTEVVENYPHFQYPPYFQAKLLLALGDNDNMLSALLPFAKRKRNDFWVWEVLAGAFENDADTVFACYCKALSCKSPEGMLVGLRKKMAEILISKQLYNEAKTEINLLVASRKENHYKIPNEVIGWQSQEWFKNATAQHSNLGFYRKYTDAAESILFWDTPEELVFVEFVNTDKKILNFIASETKSGFFKYARFFRDVKVGDILKVRFQGGSNGGVHQVYTAIKVSDDAFKKQFMKEVEGEVKIQEGRPYGFVDDIFIHPSIIAKHKLSNGMAIKGLARKAYNQERKQWGWRLI